MKNIVYTISDIKQLTKEIFSKYDVDNVYLFGSYARGDANENSDIDIMLGSKSKISLFQQSSLQDDLEQQLNKSVDIVLQNTYVEEVQSLKKYPQNKLLVKTREIFYNEIKREMIKIYE